MTLRAVPIGFLLAGLALIAATPGTSPVISSAFAGQPGRPAYVSGTADLPLMPGLREIPQDAVVFDAPSGLVVEADAIGHGVSPTAVARFYRAALPELGWHEERPLVFNRDGERLQLTIGRRRGRVTVHFDLVPG